MFCSVFGAFDAVFDWLRVSFSAFGILFEVLVVFAFCSQEGWRAEQACWLVGNGWRWSDVRATGRPVGRDGGWLAGRGLQPCELAGRLAGWLDGCLVG